MPDVIASGSWSEGSDPQGRPIGAGYCGIAKGVRRKAVLAGNAVHEFSSSHERSHILCAYGLSPFKQGKPCYALVWEGHIGCIYFIDEKIEITKLINVLPDPGFRYSFLYALADPSFKLGRGAIRLSDAGKLMAISAFSNDDPVSEEGRALIDAILDSRIKSQDLSREDFGSNTYYNCGVTHPDFANLAKLLSNKIYKIFEDAARSVVTEKLPLLISGGCGLNCEWNSRWINSGIFSDVFIPPCSNDSGSAIGTAVDAMMNLTGKAKIKWSVYAGEEPVADIEVCPGYVEHDYDPAHLACLLKSNKVFGWMRGRYEIGPRSLGARSIFASPMSKEMLTRLNHIKRRENFRPIAPICIEEEMKHYFHPSTPSRYMLEFRKVISDLIPAVTHVDGSARPQSVSEEELPDIYHLLFEFKQLTGVPVLCNTSLNFNGKGFLNRLSHLHEFALKHQLDGFVFQNRTFLKSK